MIGLSRSLGLDGAKGKRAYFMGASGVGGGGGGGGGGGDRSGKRPSMLPVYGAIVL